MALYSGKQREIDVTIREYVDVADQSYAPGAQYKPRYEMKTEEKKMSLSLVEAIKLLVDLLRQ